jgi:hypothetical protein
LSRLTGIFRVAARRKLFSNGGGNGISCERFGFGNIIGGNVSIANDDVLRSFIRENTIGKNMSVTGPSGGVKRVTNNTATGNLECSANENTSTNPFIGSPDTVMGKVTGECSK